jgi:hypothetical protein
MDFARLDANPALTGKNAIGRQESQNSYQKGSGIAMLASSQLKQEVDARSAGHNAGRKSGE